MSLSACLGLRRDGGECSLQTGSPKRAIQPSSDTSVNKTGKVSRRDRERQDGWGGGFMRARNKREGGHKEIEGGTKKKKKQEGK